MRPARSPRRWTLPADPSPHPTAHTTRGGVEADASQFLIRDVHVVDTHTGDVTRRQSILTETGRIRRITPSDVAPAPGVGQEVGGGGQDLVPGFLGMHGPAVDEAHHNPGFWKLLAQGVTGVCQMSGSSQTLALSRRFNTGRAAGTLDAPEVLMPPGGLFPGQASDEAGGPPCGSGKCWARTSWRW